MPPPLGGGSSRKSVDRFKQRCKVDSYLNRMSLTHMESILARCDEEGYVALLKLLHQVLEQSRPSGNADFESNLYYRYAGEVEARNAAYRMLRIRDSVLAEQTEEFGRDEQIISFVYGISNLTRVEWQKLSGKQPYY